MREEIKAVALEILEDSCEHQPCPGSEMSCDDCVVARIIALFADKVRGIENPCSKLTSPPEASGTYLAAEKFRTAILKELEQ